MKIFGALQETFNRQNILNNEIINQQKHLFNDVFTILQIYVFRNLWYFLGHLRIKLKRELSPIAHMRIWNTCSN